MKYIHDPNYLFTIIVPVSPRGTRPVVIYAFDGGTEKYGGHRIDVVVRHEGKTVFKRGDTRCGTPAIGGMTIDGLEAKELVLALVSIRPGDTDDEYFASYTREQIAFAEKYGEEISLYRENRFCDPETGCFDAKIAKTRNR